MRCLLALLLLAAGAVAAAAEPAAQGRYRLVGEPDVASELVISADGTFAYALAAGALDERSAGTWRRDGDTLFLTTTPKPVPGVFSERNATREGRRPLRLTVVGPDGRGLAGVDLKLGFAAGAPLEAYTQEDGWQLPKGERRRPLWVELSLPMFGLSSPRFPLAKGANRFTFLLTPNDLGTVDFKAARVDVEPGRLVLHRGPGRLVYVPVED